MTPIIALIGRPNVGKSTLFNALTKTRDALVHDMPGVTRDRQYGECEFTPRPNPLPENERGEAAHRNPEKFIVIDTGGLSGKAEGVEDPMAKQVWQAVAESDMIFFLVDGKAGICTGDEEIANRLRAVNKPCIIVVNKTDGADPDVVMSEFHQLGLGDPIAIAAAHRRGINYLMEGVKSRFATAKQLAHGQTDEDSVKMEGVKSRFATAKQLAHGQTDEDSVNESVDTSEQFGDSKTGLDPIEKRAIKVALIGRPNVGKSTLTNRILGEERVIVYDMPGTTRDSITIPFERRGKQYEVIDTAGVRRRGKVKETIEKFSIVKTLQAIEASNVVVMLLDASEALTDQDLHLLGFCHEAGRGLVIAFNKWDGLDTEQRDQIKSQVQRRLSFVKDYVDIHFISALHGTGVGDLFKSINQAYESAMKPLTTTQLNRILETAVEEHQPPLVSGRRVKLKYAHAGGHNPPLIIIHGNQVDKLPGSYQQYLINTFRKILKLRGTPIRIEFKSSDNPYADRKTPKKELSPRQIAKKKRQKKRFK